MPVFPSPQVLFPAALSLILGLQPKLLQDRSILWDLNLRFGYEEPAGELLRNRHNMWKNQIARRICSNHALRTP